MFLKSSNLVSKSYLKSYKEEWTVELKKNGSKTFLKSRNTRIGSTSQFYSILSHSTLWDDPILDRHLNFDGKNKLMRFYELNHDFDNYV